MGIDLEKQQSTVAKGDASAEPNKGAALPERQGDAQEKGAGKTFSDKIDDHGGIFLGFLVGIMALVGGIFFICNASYTFGGFLLLIGGGSIGLCVYLLLQVSKGSSLFSEATSYEPGSCGSEESDKNALQDVGTDLEKQQSPVAKGDASAEPDKDAALPKRQDDTQEESTGKILEEKHSPSDKVDPAVACLGWILGWIGLGLGFYSMFFLGCYTGRRCGPAAVTVVLIALVLMIVGSSLTESGKSDGGGDVDFDFDCDGGGDGD